jgi:hypothetical protein
LSSVENFEVAEGNTITLGNVTAAKGITVNGTLTVPTGASNFQPTENIIVNTGGELALATSAVLTLAPGKNLTLHGAILDGAKLTGAGKVVAGATEIVGGDGWQAAVAEGTVVIAAGETGGTTLKTATITGSTSVLTALNNSGTKPTITQNAVSNNNLTIATNTTINLGNITDGKLGSIVFKQSNTVPAQVTLAATGVVIEFNEREVTGTNSAIGIFAATAAANNTLVCSSFAETSGITLHIDEDDKLCKIVGGNASQTIKAEAKDGTGTADVVLSAESTVS